MIRKCVTGVFTNGGFQPSAGNADSMQKHETKDALQHFCVKLNLPTKIPCAYAMTLKSYVAVCIVSTLLFILLLSDDLDDDEQDADGHDDR